MGEGKLKGGKKEKLAQRNNNCATLPAAEVHPKRENSSFKDKRAK